MAIARLQRRHRETFLPAAIPPFTLSRSPPSPFSPRRFRSALALVSQLFRPVPSFSTTPEPSPALESGYRRRETRSLVSDGIPRERSPARRSSG